MEGFKILKLAPIFRGLRDKILTAPNVEDSFRELTCMAELITLKLKWLLPMAGLRSQSDDLEKEDDKDEPKWHLVPVMDEGQMLFAQSFLQLEFQASSGLFPRGNVRVWGLDQDSYKDIADIDPSVLKEAMIETKTRILRPRRILAPAKWNFASHLRKFWRDVRFKLSGKGVLTLSSFSKEDRTESIMNFLAFLELVKRRRLRARQLGLFGEIELTAENDEAAATSTFGSVTDGRD